MRFMDVKTITELRKYLLENRDVKSLFFHESPHSEKGIEFVQVVRCMDCKWKELCEKTLEYKGADGYCSKGERRDDAKEE